MKKFFTIATVAFFLFFSINTLTGCKQKPQEPAVEKSMENMGEEEKAPEPEAVTPAPVPDEEEPSE